MNSTETYPIRSNHLHHNAKPGGFVTSRTLEIWNAGLFARLLLLFIFFFLPIYYFPSGGIQPCDIFIIWLFFHVIIFNTKSLLRFPKKFFVPFVPFISWTIAIGLIYQAIENDPSYSYLINILYIIYGFFVLYLFTFVFSGLQLQTKRTLLYLLLVACISPFLYGNLDFTGRNTLSFNNPNQLGYYAVGVMTLALIYIAWQISLNKKLNISSIILVLSACAAANLFSYLSASRASILSIAFGNMIIAYFTLLSINLKKRLFTIFLLLFITINFASYFWITNSSFDESTIYEGTFTRLKSKKLFDIEDFKKRTIGFISFESLFAVVVGNGGKLSDDVDFEIHNTALNILKNYGFIGLFLLFIGTVISLLIIRPNLLIMLCLVPLFIYNMTHYGFRFRILWLCLAMFTAASLAIKIRSKHQNKPI